MCLLLFLCMQTAGIDMNEKKVDFRKGKCSIGFKKNLFRPFFFLVKGGGGLSAVGESRRL